MTQRDHQHQQRNSKVLIKFARIHESATIPKTYSEHAAALDVAAFILSETGRPNQIVIPPQVTRKIPTGIRVEPPPRHALWVLSRSGLATRSLWVANAPGLIDPDYRGEIFILLHNGGRDTQYISHGQRIAQLSLLPTTLTETLDVPTDELSFSLRGEDGFGSTDK